MRGEAGDPREEFYTALRNKYYELIEYGNAHPQECQQNLLKLRQLLLLEGLPPESEQEIASRLEGKGACTLRGLVWKILLNVKNVDADKYISLVNKGKPANTVYQQIRKDTCRTFMNNKDFSDSVAEEQLTRCLSAFAHLCAESPDKKANAISYVQGMNTLLGPFLYVLPEVDAFFAFSNMIFNNALLYVVSTPPLEGVHAGLGLMERILAIVDPDLYKYLHDHDFKVHTLLHTVLSLGAGTPPLSEVLHLWDFYFAFGVHMNIVCTVAQLVLIRDTLLAHPSPNSFFSKKLPALNSEQIISLAVQLVRQLPRDIYDLLVAHPTLQIPKHLPRGNNGNPNYQTPF